MPAETIAFSIGPHLEGEAVIRECLPRKLAL